MRTKRCFRCTTVLPLSEFYKHPMMADGHLNKCKVCTKADATLNRATKTPEELAAYEKKRYEDPARRKAIADSRKRARKKDPERYARYNRDDQLRHPEKRAARKKVGNAIRDGRLVKQPCEVCGAKKVQAHHDDYSKPLEVRWLCIPCHAKHHAS
jgi:ribosomal protein S27AE